MKFRLFSSSWEQARKSNNIMLVTVAALSALTLVQGIALTSTHETVVLVPPSLEKTTKVGYSTAGKEYFESFGMYFATLVGNITPKNAEFVVERLSNHVSPTIYTSLRKTLLGYAADPIWRTTGGSTRFDAEKVLYEQATSKVFIIGEYSTRNATGPVESRRITYEFIISMNEGRPMIESIDSYPGSVARTLDWREHHHAEAEQADKQSEQSAKEQAQ